MSRKKEHREHWSALTLSTSFGFKKRPKCLFLTWNQKKNVEKERKTREKGRKKRNKRRKEGREKERKLKIPDEYCLSSGKYAFLSLNPL